MCCPQNGVGVTVTCNSNCNKWCPRVLRVFCCCFGCAGDREANQTEQNVQQVVAQTIAIKEKEDTTVLLVLQPAPDAHHHHHHGKHKEKKSPRRRDGI